MLATAAVLSLVWTGTGMTSLDSLLQGIVEDPLGESRWLVLADWLDEHDDSRTAELLRLHRRLIATCFEAGEHPERAGQQARIVELLGQGVRPCVPQRTVTLTVGVEMTFSFIPPGCFLMGSPTSEEDRFGNETLHRVALASGFRLGVQPVTQAQWRAVMGESPSGFKGDDLPVENVSWDDCQHFCRNLGDRTGKRFRLPTEAEWEYACRAGTTTPFHSGETISTDQANYDGNYTYGKGQKGVYREKTTRPGSFPANAWGLFDMHGNVFEWCSSRLGGVANPAFGGGHKRVIRGGSWFDGPLRCRSAYRYAVEPGRRDDGVGCRVVQCPD
jgi:uncharacterized protein (TIGR02996 family)